jgi:hypothetical protein
MVVPFKGRIWADDIQEQVTEEDIWAEKGEGIRRLKAEDNYVIRNFIIFNFHLILRGCSNN